MHQLHPRSVWIFFITASRVWALIFVFLVWQTGLLMTELSGEVRVFAYIAWIAVAFVLCLILTYVWARLSYRFYRYELTEDGFRKERGVISKKYVTIPYARIQNVDINRGILARLLGLSDLHIQTAGASSNTARGEGRLPGLAHRDAETMRDELIRRARQSGNQGL